MNDKYEALVDRVKRLERSNVLLKSFCMFMILLFGAKTLVAENSTKVLDVSEIVLRDIAGNIRYHLKTNENMEISESIFDKNGKERIRSYIDNSNIARVRLFDDNQNDRTGMTTFPSIMKEKDLENKAAMYVFGHGNSGDALKGGIIINSYFDGSSCINAFDKSGTIRISSGVDEDYNSYAAFYGKKGDEEKRAAIGVNGNGDLYVGAFNKEKTAGLSVKGNGDLYVGAFNKKLGIYQAL